VPRYSYIALNQQHQKLTGVLSAESESNAREKLHAMAFSVVALKEEAEVDYQKNAEEGVLTFAFFFRDANGKESKGTIDAPDRKTAFRRLIAEYNFEILSLAEATIPEEKRFEEGKIGLEDLAAEVEEEFGISFKKQGANEEEETKVNEAFLERKKELVRNVEEIVQQSREVLEKFKDDMTGDEVHSIKMRVDDLMRMRLSNNLKYIQDLSDDLLTVVDEALRRHAVDDETVKELAEEIAEDITDETMYQNAIEEHGALANLKNASKRLKRMMNGYKRQHQQALRHKKRLQGEDISEKKNPFLTKIRLSLRLFSRSFSQLLSVVLSKNSAVRRQHWEMFRENFSSFFGIFQKSNREILEVEAKMEKHFAEQDEDIQPSATAFSQKTIFHWIEESHLFFGWLLSFYVIYFYLGVFVIVKGVEEASLFSFLERSLTNAFPFLVTGIFFFLFLGLTLSLRFARQKIWLAPFFLGGSTFLSVLFVLNF